MPNSYVKQMNIKTKMTLGELAKEFKNAGVLGAGRFGRAVSIVSNLFQSSQYLVFLSLAGPLVPAGLRNIIADLIRTKRINIIVSSGANIVHDILEAIGGHHIQGSLEANDQALYEQQLGRAGDVYVETEGFEKLEDFIQNILNNLSEDRRKTGLSPSELLAEIGYRLNDQQSILYQAYHQKVPVFCPGLLDSMLGLHLAIFRQLRSFHLDGLKDMKILYDHVNEAEKVGAIILGGGLPKHFTLGANILRGGLDSAVQITTARDEDGSLSGAKLKEGISWGKVKSTATFETIIGDATLLFPLLIGAVLDNLDSD